MCRDSFRGVPGVGPQGGPVLTTLTASAQGRPGPAGPGTGEWLPPGQMDRAEDVCRGLQGPGRARRPAGSRGGQGRQDQGSAGGRGGASAGVPDPDTQHQLASHLQQQEGRGQGQGRRALEVKQPGRRPEAEPLGL